MPNKIQIPVKTKIVAMFLALMAFWLFYSTVGDSRWFDDLLDSWSIMAGSIYGLVAAGLFFKRKFSWYVGVFILGMMNLLLLLVLADDFGKNTSDLYIIFVIEFSLMHFAALILLLSDRKNYFAAVDRSKNEQKEGALTRG